MLIPSHVSLILSLFLLGWVKCVEKVTFSFILVSVNHMDVVCNACRVLLKYLVNSLQQLSTEPVPNTTQATRYLNAIKSLCLGTGALSAADQNTLMQTMKNENLPPHIKTNTAGKSLHLFITLLSNFDLSSQILTSLLTILFNSYKSFKSIFD